LQEQAKQLGFTQLRVVQPDLTQASQYLREWLERGYHGEMDWMNRNLELREQPGALEQGTLRVISLTMPYLQETTEASSALLQQPDLAYLSRYALGRDYHRVLKARMNELIRWLQSQVPTAQFRCFTDSAPVMEVEIAAQSGLGWRGKHTLLLNREGSFFFLGEIFTDLELPVDEPVEGHCGDCQRCLEVCPTGAILGPYQLDARRCISYLTIEHPGSIPEELREPMGNRVYGCDDCQLFCPWNRFAQTSHVADFNTRHALDQIPLATLFLWSETDFHERFAGSAIHRIGFERFLRNVAIGLGNGPATPDAIAALKQRENHPSALVQEHVRWALKRLEGQC
jgi:epoxyqueuosine reductase